VPEPTTPPPLYFSGTPKTAPVPYMTSAERSTYRAAAWRATKLFGAIGELISRELLATDEFGWAPGADALSTRVRDEVMELWRAHEAAQAEVAGLTGPGGGR
jgi:hypothetical protein